MWLQLLLQQAAAERKTSSGRVVIVNVLFATFIGEWCRPLLSESITRGVEYLIPVLSALGWCHELHKASGRPRSGVCAVIDEKIPEQTDPSGISFLMSFANEEKCV